MKCAGACLLVAWLFGCATPPADRPGDAKGRQEAAQSAGTAPALPPTDADVMYRVFAGEVSGADGDLEKAAANYLEAALASDDPEIAKRATAVALAAQVWQYAAMAADRWTQLAPDDPEACETAARSLLLTGDYIGAEHQLGNLLDLYGDDPEQGWRKVSELLALAHHADKAESMVMHLAGEHGGAGNPWALFTRSQVAARDGNLALARELAEQACTLAPDNADLQAWTGRLAINQGDRGAALAYFEQAWKLQPDDRNYALLYANVLRQQGQLKDANEVLAGLPDEPELRFTRIAFALESDDRDLAESLFRGFDQADYPDPEVAAFNAARSAELLDMPEAAVRWYAKVTSGDRALAALVRRAFLLSGLNRVDEARQVLQDARRNGDASTRVESLIAESQILMDNGSSKEAFELLGKALKQTPDDIRLRYTRAMVAVEMNRLDAAEQDLRSVLKAEPQNATALNALGYTLADRTSRYEEAQKLIDAAYALEPDEASIIDSKGWIAFRLGRLEEAESYLREALQRDQNAEIAAHLGEVLWKMGRSDEARSVWSLASQIDADNRVLRDTLKRFGVQL